MQMLILLLIMALFTHDTVAWVNTPALSGWAMLAAVLGPYLMVAAVLAAARRFVLARLDQPTSQTWRSVTRLERLAHVARVSAALLFLFDLFFLGWLLWLRQMMGDWIVVDELLALLPPLGLIAVTWWLYYPIDRRLREASLIRQIDSGGPVYPIWTCRQYLLSQFRHQVLLLLLPMFLLIAWGEVVNLLVPPGNALAPYQPLLLMAGGAGVFLFAPMVLRHVWDTIPLPAGLLRNRLLDLCQSHGVRVRELLLWRTYGGMINGAVMGLIAPLRYILLTDALIERLPPEQVEAVMAHELGHVRRHHMFWLVIGALGPLALLATIGDTLLWLLRPVINESPIGQVNLGAFLIAGDPTAATATTFTGMNLVELLALAGVVAGWLVVFGYISRRFERQADTFAVEHLNTRYDHHDVPEGGIGPNSAQIMAAALRNVAGLNHTSINRRSWRHGSIAWRIQYLQQLPGKHAHDLPINREVRRLRWACAAMLLLAGLGQWWLSVIA